MTLVVGAPELPGYATGCRGTQLPAPPLAIISTVIWRSPCALLSLKIGKMCWPGCGMELELKAWSLELGAEEEAEAEAVVPARCSSDFMTGAKNVQRPAARVQ